MTEKVFFHFLIVCFMMFLCFLSSSIESINVVVASISKQHVSFLKCYHTEMGGALTSPKLEYSLKYQCTVCAPALFVPIVSTFYMEGTRMTCSILKKAPSRMFDGLQL